MAANDVVVEGAVSEKVVDFLANSHLRKMTSRHASRGDPGCVKILKRDPDLLRPRASGCLTYFQNP